MQKDAKFCGFMYNFMDSASKSAWLCRNPHPHPHLRKFSTKIRTKIRILICKCEHPHYLPPRILKLTSHILATCCPSKESVWSSKIVIVTRSPNSSKTSKSWNVLFCRILTLTQIWAYFTFGGAYFANAYSYFQIRRIYFGLIWRTL